MVRFMQYMPVAASVLNTVALLSAVGYLLSLAARMLGLAAGGHAAVAALGIAGGEEIMRPKEHGTCRGPPPGPLRWGADLRKADRICCYNRHSAEYAGYWLSTEFLKAEGAAAGEISFYDSVSGRRLFVAPRGRSFESFVRESRAHGWPSFRDQEVVVENVRVLPDGEVVSVDGTHLGHNLPDGTGNRYCINIVSVAGPPPAQGAIGTVPQLEAASVVQQEGAEDVRDVPISVGTLQSPLRNRYWAVRHGQSEANAAGVISSDPVTGSTIHGLTALGKSQAREAAVTLMEAIGPDRIPDVLLYSSNFTRARQTAAEVGDDLEGRLGLELGSLQVNIEIGLRERCFGELEGEYNDVTLAKYKRFCSAEMKDATYGAYGVESVDEVCRRVKGVIETLEGRHSGKDIVLASHGDTLQILQTFMAGVDPRSHGSFRFRNGEVRRLLVADTAMTPPVPMTSV